MFTDEDLAGIFDVVGGRYRASGWGGAVAFDTRAGMSTRGRRVPAKKKPPAKKKRPVFSHAPKKPAVRRTLKRRSFFASVAHPVGAAAAGSMAGRFAGSSAAVSLVASPSAGVKFADDESGGVYGGTSSEEAEAAPPVESEAPSLDPRATIRHVERVAPSREEDPGEEEEPADEEEPAEADEAEEGDVDGLEGLLMSGRDVMVLGDLAGLAQITVSNSDQFPSSGDGGPVFTPTTGPAQAIPEPEAPPPPPKGSGWPNAAKPSAAAWAHGDGTYVVQRGDSVSGISRTYLGAYERWREIWRIQTREFLGRHPTPDKIQIGDVMQMPKEAQDNARKMGLLKGLSSGGKKGLVIGGVVLGGTALAAIGYGLYSGAIGG